MPNHFISIQRFNGGNETPLYQSAQLCSGAPHSSAGKLQFVDDDAVIDNGGIINSINNEIVIKQSGIYRISASCTARINSQESGYDGAWWLQVTTNNQEIAQTGVELGPVDSNDRHTASTEVIINLSEHDTVDVRVAPQGVTASVTVYTISINVQQLS